MSGQYTLSVPATLQGNGSYMLAVPATMHGLAGMETWDGFREEAARSGYTVADFWKTQYEYFMSLAHRKLSLANMAEDPLIKPALVQKAQDLIEELDANRTIYPQLDYLDENTRRRLYGEFWATGKAVEAFGRDLEVLVPASLLSAQQASQAAAAARAAMTPQELKQIKDRAGSDELYFAQLQNNLYQSKLASQYANLLGPEVTAAVKAQIDATQTWLEQNRPSAVLEGATGAMEAALDLVNRTKDSIPSPMTLVGNILKWGTIIGGTALLLTIAGTKKAIRSIRRR